jgi:anaphase-promoting complex subunit 11
MLKGWTGVALWKWIANDDNCGICRMAFEGKNILKLII